MPYGDEGSALLGIGSHCHHRRGPTSGVDNGCDLSEDLPPDEEVAPQGVIGPLDVGKPRDDRLRPLEGDLSEVGHARPYPCPRQHCGHASG